MVTFPLSSLGAGKKRNKKKLRGESERTPVSRSQDKHKLLHKFKSKRYTSFILNESVGYKHKASGGEKAKITKETLTEGL